MKVCTNFVFLPIVFLHIFLTTLSFASTKLHSNVNENLAFKFSLFEMKRCTKVNLSPLVRDGVGSKPSFGDFQDVYRSFDIMLAVLSYISLRALERQEDDNT